MHPVKNFRPWAIGVLLALASVPVVQAAAQQAAVSVDLPSELERGKNGEITVTIDGSRVGAFEIEATCSQTGALRFIDLTNGTGPPGFSIVGSVRDANTAAIAGFMSSEPITSGTVVATITFAAVKETASPVDIELSGKLYDPEGNEIEAVFSGKTINVTKNAALDMIFYLRIAGGILVFVILCAFIAVWVFSRHKKRRLSKHEKLSLHFE